MSHVGTPRGPYTAQTTPLTISIADSGKALRMAYEDSEHWIPASRLRTACRCAHCTRARIDGRFPSAFEGVTIQSLSPMGQYGLNIGFSDGHGRGIYPWSYLDELLKS
jgi:DUF971 family protein